MKKNLLSFALLLLAMTATFAQQAYLNQVIVLNEGYYNYTTQTQDVPVTIGTYNPTTKVYHAFDTIAGSRFATDVLVDNNTIYAAADNKINMYDANSYALLHSVAVPGVRKLAIWNNQLLVSRGEYLVTYNSYFQVYDKSNLSFIYDLTTANGPQYAADKIVVQNDIAYLAVNNGFDFGNYKGLIGVIDLTNHTYGAEIQLPNAATNPENLMIAGGTDLVTLNNNDFTNSSVSKIGIGSGTGTTNIVVSGSGCSTSALAAITGTHYVLYQAFGDMQLGKYDLNNNTIAAPVAINKSIYGIAINPMNNEIYTGVTDFSTFGKVYIHYANGFPRDSFNVSVSPGNMAFDFRINSGIEQVNANEGLKVINSLVENQVEISVNTEKATSISIIDAAGKTVQTGMYNPSVKIQQFDVTTLANGMYLIRSGNGASARFIKM